MQTIYQTTHQTTYESINKLHHNATDIESLFTPLLEQIWADADQVLAMVKQDLSRLNSVNTSNREITFASWNAEYLWQAKANHFIDTYREIISKHHILALQEVSRQGLFTLSQYSGYNQIVSQSNNRGQAVGFLIHPRFSISNIYEYNELLNVFGISNLRPALRVDLVDKQSNLKLSVITVHLKSMLGGLAFTSKIRQEQLRQLMIALGENPNPTIIAGDFNCFLDTAADIDPLLSSGYSMANKNNHTSTQSSGGRLDGLFYRNLGLDLSPKHYNIRNFWRQSLAGRSLSDHGLLTWKISK